MDGIEEHLRACPVCRPMLEDYLEIKRLREEAHQAH